MKKMLRYSVAAGVLMFATESSWALGWYPPDNGGSCRPQCGTVRAPEIDAASGTSAIAVLAGVLAIAMERRNRRK
jgi:hypothetical protein